MRALLPDPVEDPDVHAHYARGWLDRGGVRANMVASVDGAAAADGRSVGLQTAGDNRVFAALRDLADVVLVGAATAAAEGYRPARLDAERLATRAAYGLRPDLPIALVTRSLAVDASGPLFADPARRPIVVTCGAADPARRAEVGAVADVIACGEDEIDFAATRSELADRGLTRLLSEGGPTLLSRLVAAGAVDELCLSVTPLLAGPGAERVVAGEPWPATRRLRLTGLLEEGGALFLRYGSLA